MADKKYILDSSELATYVVCPEAWRLKLLRGENLAHPSKRAKEVKEKRKEWVKTQETSSQLRYYAKILYSLLLLIVITLFIIELKSSKEQNQQHHMSAVGD